MLARGGQPAGASRWAAAVSTDVAATLAAIAPRQETIGRRSGYQQSRFAAALYLPAGGRWRARPVGGWAGGGEVAGGSDVEADVLRSCPAAAAAAAADDAAAGPGGVGGGPWQLRGARNLMVVAHPDDELVFGAHDLLTVDPGSWAVLVLTDCGRRGAMLLEAARRLDVAFVAQLAHVADASPLTQFDARVAALVGRLLRCRRWERVVTHNRDGEYGHVQHGQVHDIVVGAVGALLRRPAAAAAAWAAPPPPLWTFCDKASVFGAGAEALPPAVQATSGELLRDVYGLQVSDWAPFVQFCRSQRHDAPPQQAAAAAGGSRGVLQIMLDGKEAQLDALQPGTPWELAFRFCEARVAAEQMERCKQNLATVIEERRRGGIGK